MHVVIDLFDCHEGSLDEPQVVADFLHDAVEAMGMVALDDPQVYEVDNDEPGVTGIVVITESHLSVHTFPLRGIAWVDLFSCRSFDHERLVAMTIEALGAGSAEFQVIQRGFGVRRAPRTNDLPVVPWLKTGPPVQGPEAPPVTPHEPGFV